PAHLGPRRPGAAGRARGRRRRRPPRRPVSRLRRVGPLAADGRPDGCADAAGHRHHLGPRALVGDASDRAHRGVDQADEGGPPGGPAARRRREPLRLAGPRGDGTGAHERPRFRAADWGHYRAVNERFAKALLQEMEAVEAPIVLVQDYHFALLPRLVKEARPDARVALFWHIPWPNFEAVGICPWQSDI